MSITLWRNVALQWCARALLRWSGVGMGAALLLQSSVNGTAQLKKVGVCRHALLWQGIMKSAPLLQQGANGGATASINAIVGRTKEQSLPVIFCDVDRLLCCTIARGRLIVDSRVTHVCSRRRCRLRRV